MRPARRLPTVVAVLLVSTTFSALLAAPAGALSSTDLLEKPRLAIGFNWTYSYAGPTDQSVGAFRATYMADTYLSTVVDEATTPRGDAWVVRNYHTGHLTGTAFSLPATGDFTSDNFYYFRKSDLSMLNSTQDLQVTAYPPIGPAVTGSQHNDTYANPPFAQIAFGSPADGTPWRIVTNLTWSGWYKIGSGAPTNQSGYVDLDYNLSVTAIEDALVPAGTLPSYNISGSGTAVADGTPYSFYQQFLWAPSALNKAVDESGYTLQAFTVNRPPDASGLPPLSVEAGSSATLNLTAYVTDPDGDTFTLSCGAPASLNCSVAPNGTLTVAADPGVNATLFVNLTADDGKTNGLRTFALTVLVTDPANNNQPPEWSGPPIIEFGEDDDAAFALASFIFDPDDTAWTFSLDPQSPIIVLSQNATHFTLHAPPNYYGETLMDVTVFDSAGNSLFRTLEIWVHGVNDLPEIVAVSATELYVHTLHNVSALVTATDADGPSPTIDWAFDGADVLTLADPTNFTYYSPAEDFGVHTLTATASDGIAQGVSVSFVIVVFVGPTLTFHSPSAVNVRAVNGSNVAFEIRASDPDTPTLNFTWSSPHATPGHPPIVFHAGPNHTTLDLHVAQSTPFDIIGTAEDNGSFVGFVWHVTVEEVPTDLVEVLSPHAGSAFAYNSTVNVSAFVDPRISDLNLTWSLDGVPFSTSGDARTGPLSGSHNYTLRLTVSGLYNGSVPYSTTLFANFSVIGLDAPPPGAGNPPAPSTNSDFALPLLLVLAAAAAAVAYVLYRRRRQPPSA